MNNKIYECKNLGCRSIFNWPMQLARHSKKYCKPKPVEKEKKYYQRDGVYVCCQCNKQFGHQSNIIRHTKKCGNKKQKQVYDCHKCEKSFSFKCRLTAHLKNHVLICNVCNSKFRRPELVDQHCMNCVDLHDE